jgi:predicted Zn-dependent protease
VKRALIAILTASVCVAAGAQEQVRLPDIGSSAAAIISPDQERQIGEQMMRSLHASNAVADDPLLNEYLSQLGYRLVAHSEGAEQDFTFFIVRSEQINAFAAPGGYVGLNTGLIATAESESEVAAVLAHEVSHITQRHLVRAVESMQKVSLPIMLAMLGALIAAQGSNGDAAQAAVIGGSALLQQQQINFTRGNEYEADRIGMQTLAKAGYEPDAMATFFWRMGRATRSNTGEGVPEFLRTHPVTSTRISEAKDRAAQIAREQPQAAPAPEDAGVLALYAPPSATGGRSSALEVYGQREDQARAAREIRALHAKAAPAPTDTAAFLRFRERSRVLGANNPGDLVPYYQRAIAAADGDLDSLHYGLALAQTRAGAPRDAQATLRPLLATHPAQPAFALAMAEAEDAAGRPELARARLAALSAQFPGNRAVGIAHAQQLVASGSPQAAASAVEMLRPLLAEAGDDALLQLTFARACELAGDEIRAGEAHAEVALINGQFDDALKQLTSLLRRTDVDYYQRARIEARIAQITPIALEQRRRMVPGQV